ncbi:Uncharacterised protein [[Clostridium] sordellii]|uniref:hypothetical protein n=1 Tax=Paraclostridium sordellii TaxID=1505 RepID=UPI0005DB736B|nr:hypothetical protein [Paeniclostridium sordellii]MDU2148635.1 hypothetical protein [Paeniclostridium sordellii]CEQ31843.1 Uncharacterised protein [[Clostridium] sordellii] [Paeniclostridium sordellii]
MSRLTRSNNDKSKLCRFGYVDYIVLASSLAVAISEEVNVNDLNILATFFAVLSDELALISSVKSCTESSSSNNSSSEEFPAAVPDTALTRSKSKVKKRKKVKKIYKKL